MKAGGSQPLAEPPQRPRRAAALRPGIQARTPARRAATLDGVAAGGSPRPQWRIAARASGGDSVEGGCLRQTCPARKTAVLDEPRDSVHRSDSGSVECSSPGAGPGRRPRPSPPTTRAAICSVRASYAGNRGRAPGSSSSRHAAGRSRHRPAPTGPPPTACRRPRAAATADESWWLQTKRGGCQTRARVCVFRRRGVGHRVRHHRGVQPPVRGPRSGAGSRA
ncbi:uncharacterized protein V1510DRAFT_164708 [Dipodascopsis tothii]|uniref:uncharacterized protein n=1 Tax=Dipodascopsis tothii TaxID=44089 RepID=UPI0034CFD7C7